MARREGPLQMRAGEALRRDVGKKRARLGPEAMEHLRLSPGDVVEVTGTRATCAVAWPADGGSGGPDVIRLDGQTRKNAGAALGGRVRVRRASSRAARTAVLSRAGGAGGTEREFADFVRGRLKGLPLLPGDEVPLTILGAPAGLRLERAAPAGIVRIEKSTALEIAEGGDARGRPRVTYEEVGGLGAELRAMREAVELPLRHPELFGRMGVEPHSGILLYGPPGCGKTLIAKVLASESEASMYSINGPEIMNKYYGETEARLRDIFREARDNSPSIIFIDEIDAIAPKREEAYGDVEKRVVAQLLALMDGLNERGNVVVLGATNRPDSVDPALRRPGRFDREVEVSVPNEDGRHEVLQIHTRGMPLADGVDLRALAADLHGYTGADIKSLCREAAMGAIRRCLPEAGPDAGSVPPAVLGSMEVRAADFYGAMQGVVPTAMRELYVERPKVWWRDVGGLGAAKEALSDNLIAAMRDPGRFARMGVRPPRGALVYGPPGCGKTLLARAMAAESGANMILVRGPELLSKWVGESEKAVREIFRKAKASSPCVVILDELDSLARAREGGDGGAGETVLGQLLTEMDDAAAPGVAVVGITSRPDLLDRSLMRTGRLDLALYVPPPDERGRLEIIRILVSGMPLAPDVRPGEIAVSTQNYTGADLAALCREAAVRAMRAAGGAECRVRGADFAAALAAVPPSITKEADRWYSSVREGMSSPVPKALDKAPYG